MAGDQRDAATDTSTAAGEWWWCETDTAVRDADGVRRGVDGHLVCRTCGDPVSPLVDDEDEGSPKAPWHFKILLLGTIGYLIYRVIWFIEWIQHR